MDTFREYSFSCLFTVAKIYTYIQEFVKHNCSSCIDNKLNFHQDFYNLDNEPMYISTITIDKSNTFCRLVTSKYPANFSFCDFSFINITVTFDSIDYTIDLSNKNHNFYCLDNVIDFDLIYWYMTYVHNIKNFNKNYTCVILDNNYNFINLSPEEKIILKSNSYVKVS